MKSEVLPIRFNKEQRLIFDKMYKAFLKENKIKKISYSAFGRAKILEETSFLNPEIVKNQNKIFSQLLKTGNNINQISRSINEKNKNNITDYTSEINSFEEIKQDFKELKNLLMDIRKML